MAGGNKDKIRNKYKTEIWTTSTDNIRTTHFLTVVLALFLGHVSATDNSKVVCLGFGLLSVTDSPSTAGWIKKKGGFSGEGKNQLVRVVDVTVMRAIRFKASKFCSQQEIWLLRIHSA